MNRDAAGRPVGVDGSGQPVSTELPIFVTQPHLPPLAEFLPYLEQIWQSRILTNQGPMHERFERALCEYLGVPHVSLLVNGTLALVTALQCLRITGEVITTPYSFVATAHALVWNGIKPVFVDIAPETFNIDPARVEAAITPQTTAILAVHCYGNPSELEAIQRIADLYNLRVIHDAAHAFGVRLPGTNLFEHGDLSVLSFHATKVFNTFEGGAIVCRDAKMKQRIDHLKNFGFVDEVTVVAPGINGKMNEFCAAFGLLQLQYIEAVIERRRQIDERWRRHLSGIEGIRCFEAQPQVRSNHAYFPVLVERAYPMSRDGLYEHLKQHGIYARRYFYPLISQFPVYRGLPSAAPSNLPNATSVASRVLCLPIYPALTDAQIDRMADILAAPTRGR